MNDEFYGRCDTCAAKVKSRYHTISRNIERYQFDADDTKLSVTCTVLRSDRLEEYCGEECCNVGVYCQLNDRGMEIQATGPGPIVQCSKCTKPLDMRQTHVAFEVMDQTEIRQPWLVSVEPHGSEIVARLCSLCDSDLAFDEDLETEVQVEKARPVEALIT